MFVLNFSWLLWCYLIFWIELIQQGVEFMGLSSNKIEVTMSLTNVYTGYDIIKYLEIIDHELSVYVSSMRLNIF